MAKWNEYGLKTGTSARDEVLILDSDTNTNKRITVEDIQEFANGKMLEKENTALNTEAKTLIGAINEVDAKNDAQDANLEAIEKKFSSYVKKTDVDSTLSVAGSPADAKVVGEQFKSNEKAIAELADKKITKFYASSQGNTHLPDSDKGKIQDMFLYGKSEQAQYKGKNLIQGREVNSTSNGITYKYNGDGTYTVNGTATTDTFFIVYGNFANLYGGASSLKLVGCPSGGSAQKYFLRGYRKNGDPVNSDEYGSGIIINNFEEAGSNIAIVIRSGVTVNNLVFKPMLTEDLTATYADFEPYVGGIPSPNPEYPQEIKSVVNPVVKVRGKNLLDKNMLEYGSISATGTNVVANTRIRTKDSARFKVKKGEKYVLSSDVLKSGSIMTYINGVYSPTSAVIDSEWRTLPYAFTVNMNAELRFVFRIDNTTSINLNNLNDLQLEYGTTHTAYEPYTEQSVTLPYTLYAIPVSTGGNVTIDGQQYVADYVDVERGKLVRNVMVIDDLGIFNWTYVLSEKRAWTRISDIFSINSPRSVDAYSEEYYPLTAEGSYLKKSPYSISVGNDQLYIADERFTSGAEFKNGLKGKTAYAIYKTPKEIDLKPEEITLFKSLTTNYPVTNIEVNSDKLEGYTIFNYPISMADGWNYVKQQLNDNRDYIYDMDLQSAEAYVNSEYAVALTELEVM